MTELENQVVEAWNIHNRITLHLISHISDEALRSTLSTRGGRDVARQLAHMHMVRVWRLESFAKKAKLKLPVFEKDISPGKEALLDAFRLSGQAMEQYLIQSLSNNAAVSNFKRGVVPMLGYYISHEAHHRGSIMLTLKKSGFKLPDELKWGIWEWNKM